MQTAPSKRFGTLLLLFLFSFLVSCYPSSSDVEVNSLQLESRDLNRRYTGEIRPPTNNPDNPTSDYPDDDAIKKAFIKPTGPYVFYAQTEGSVIPHQFAVSVKGVTLADVFPEGYLLKAGRSRKWLGNFIDRASGIFADNAHGEVFFVSDWDLNGNVDACRVWKRVELPSLLKNSKVTKITLVNYKNFSQKKELPLNVIGKRDENHSLSPRATFTACNDWEGYGDDPNYPGHGAWEAYEPGQCGLHFRQYQKNEGPGSPTSQYRYTITLKDNEGETIGGIAEKAIPNKGYFSLDSRLPNALVVQSGSVDSDPVSFGYAGFNFNSASGSCKTGKYDSGSRQGDCSFTCK